jgi:hypothetical protein
MNAVSPALEVIEATAWTVAIKKKPGLAAGLGV